MRAHPGRLRIVALTTRANRTKVERADVAVAEATGPARGSIVVRLLGSISEVADQPPLIALSAATMMTGLFARNARLANVGGRMLAAELVATGIKSAIKHRVDRTRPHVLLDGGAYAMERGESDASADNSFPSGHTAGAVAVARSIARTYPDRATAAYGAAAAAAIIQVPRAKHYPSDVAAGVAIGLAADWLVMGAERLLVALVRRSD